MSRQPSRFPLFLSILMASLAALGFLVPLTHSMVVLRVYLACFIACFIAWAVVIRQAGS